MKTVSKSIAGVYLALQLMGCGAAVAGTGDEAAGSASGKPEPPDIATALAQWSSKHLVMFYRQETASAPPRLDPAVQAVTLALEHELLGLGYRVTEPSPAAYKAMDEGGPYVIVTFGSDAGPSMVYSVYTDTRPEPGANVSIAEVRISARVFLGASLLAADEGSGEMEFRNDPALREYGQRKADELAAGDAAADLAARVDARLKSLTSQQVATLIAGNFTQSTAFTIVAPQAPPPTGAPSATPVAPTAPSAPAPAAPSTPATPSTPGAPPASAAPSTPSAPASAPTGGGSAPSSASSATTSPPPPPPAASGKRWLVTIGVSDYSHVLGIPDSGTHAHDLPGTPTDVRNIRQTLAGFGFEDATSVNLFDAGATTEAVRQTLSRLATSVGPNDTVVLYISGHGMKEPWSADGMAMPVLYDTNIRDAVAGNDVFDFSTLAGSFSQIPAKQLLLVIDTCFSGRATVGLGLTTITVSSRGVDVAAGGGAPDILRMMTRTSGSQNIAVMTAARPTEASLDEGTQLGGLFTSNFVQGLQQTRGQMPIEALFRQYVWSQVVETSRSLCAQDPDPNPAHRCQQQTPVLGYSGVGNLIELAAAADPQAPQARAFDLVTSSELRVWSRPGQTWTPRDLLSSGSSGSTSCHSTTPASAPDGPGIDILRPALGKPLNDPIDISVAFVKHGDAAIVPAAFRVCYVTMFATVDITKRVTDRAPVTQQGLNVTGARLPSGHHHLFLLIADQSGHVGRRDVIVDIR